MPLMVQAITANHVLHEPFRHNGKAAGGAAYPAEGMIAYAVSRRVNSPKNDDPKRW
jgi:hypothetical protein